VSVDCTVLETPHKGRDKDYQGVLVKQEES
jgi:hypothetical protein